ncbi:MAG: hypothetical protein AAF587_09040 [Bacteroidota bacterium]
MEETFTLKKIDQYLAGSMTSEEEKEFEREVASKPELKDLLDQSLRTRYAIHQAGSNLQKEELGKEWDKWETQQRQPVFSSYAWMSMAAGIALILGLGFFFLRPSPLSPEELFVAHYEHPETPTIRKIDQSDSLTVAMVNSLYAKGEYVQAVEAYESLLPHTASSQIDELRFFLGISYLQIKQEENALEQWQALSSDYYQNSGKWYGILAKIRLKRLEEAKVDLTELAKNGSPYYQERAIRLLEDL